MNLNDQMTLINKLLNPIKRRVMLTVGRAILSAAADDSKKMQSLQISLLSDETKDDVERFQNYGFTSVPFEGAEACTVFVGGDRDHGIVIAVDDRRYRLKGLEAGEVAMYTDQDDKIVLKRDGTIEVVSSTEVKVTTKTATVTAETAVNITTKNATITAETKAVINAPLIELGDSALEAVVNGETFKTLYNAHTHVSGAPGSPTAPPTVPMAAPHLSLKVKAAK